MATSSERNQNRSRVMAWLCGVSVTSVLPAPPI